MSLIQRYDGKDVHKENGKFLLKDGDKVVGTYTSMAGLTKANPRGRSSTTATTATAPAAAPKAPAKKPAAKVAPKADDKA